MRLLANKFFLLILGIGLLAGQACKEPVQDEPTQPQEQVTPELAKLNAEVDENPRTADPYFRRASYHLDQGSFNKAMVDISKAIEIDSTKAEYYITLADAYFYSKAIAKCEKALNKSLEVEPNNIDALLKMSEFKLYGKYYRKSLEYANQVLELDNRNASAYFLRAVNFLDMNDTAKAIVNLQQTVENNQQHFKAYLNLGILYTIKKSKLAIDYLNNAAQIQPENPDVYYNMGLFYQSTDSLNKAIKAYTQVIQIAPNYKYAHYNLGYIHYQFLRVNEQALKHFDDAVKCDPQYYQAVYMRGLCYEAMGDEKRAKAEYTRALAIKPDYELALKGTKRLLNLK